MKAPVEKHLHPFVEEAAEELLSQLAQEKCLYTRIAICEALECGEIHTAEKMTEYLGVIGNNQHRENQIILWKMLLCLSAFPCKES